MKHPIFTAGSAIVCELGSVWKAFIRPSGTFPPADAGMTSERRWT
jgi:hypothetical protein